MDKKEFYDKAIYELNAQYDLARRLLVSGNRKLALSSYHRVNDFLDFMWRIDLIDFDEMLELRDEHYEFFNANFLS